MVNLSNFVPRASRKTLIVSQLTIRQLQSNRVEKSCLDPGQVCLFFDVRMQEMDRLQVRLDMAVREKGSPLSCLLDRLEQMCGCPPLAEEINPVLFRIG